MSKLRIHTSKNNRMRFLYLIYRTTNSKISMEIIPRKIWNYYFQVTGSKKFKHP